MSSRDQITLLILAVTVVIAVTYTGVRWALQRIESDRRVEGPDGLWWVRLHWSHPDLSMGVARRLFKLRSEDLRALAPTPRSPSGGRGQQSDQRQQAKRKQRSSTVDSLAEVGGCLDAVPALGLVVVGAVALVLIIGLAIELAVFVVGAGAVTLLRTLFGHPWSIEVDDPSGVVHLLEVRGWGNARAAAAITRESIATGEFDIDAIEALAQSD